MSIPESSVYLLVIQRGRGGCFALDTEKPNRLLYPVIMYTGSHILLFFFNLWLFFNVIEDEADLLILMRTF